MAINHLFRQLTSCIVVFIVAMEFGATSMNAEKITDFSPSNFLVINRNNYSGYIPQYGGDPNTYRLTDTLSGSVAVAMWNTAYRINMNQEWLLNMRLFFDTGQYRRNWRDNKYYPPGHTYREISDGICWVATTQNITPNLIGENVMYIGYGGNIGYGATTGGIGSSFAVEFDTEWDGDGFERTDAMGGAHCHVAYLRNANMAAIPGTFRQMQNNWANVSGIKNWICVSIFWRIGYNPDNSKYYDLLTYIKEGAWNGSGEIILRDSMRFDSLYEFIEGLELDENDSAHINWGITSGTCNNANRQMIQFSSLTMGDVFNTTSTILIEGEGIPDDTFRIAKSATVLTECGTITMPGQTNTTITYDQVLCHNKFNELKIFALAGIDTTSARWEFKKGSSGILLVRVQLSQLAI